MSKLFKTSTLFSVLFTIIAVIFYRHTSAAIWLTFSITLGTFAYHFVMRMLTGAMITVIMHNRADYRKKWYQPRRFEPKLYERLNVKKWKGFLPTYQPDFFSLQKHTLDEIAQAMCQSEIIHEIIVVLSFLPLLFAIPFGDFAVFFFTSLAAAGFDALFVIMQRYNRPRILALLERQK